jgi:hypothetical protein
MLFNTLRKRLRKLRTSDKVRRVVRTIPRLEGLEERWCPYASPTVWWKGGHSTDWGNGANFVNAMGADRASTFQPGTTDVVGVWSTVTNQPTISAATKTIGGLNNIQGGTNRQLQLTLQDGGTLKLDPTVVTASILRGAGTSWIKLDGTSAFRVNNLATFDLDVNATLVGVGGTPGTGTVYVTNSATFNDLGGNQIGCNVSVGDDFSHGTFVMASSATQSTSFLGSYTFTVTTGSTLALGTWLGTVNNIGFTDANTGTVASTTIHNFGTIQLDGADGHAIKIELPIHNDGGTILCSGNDLGGAGHTSTFNFTNSRTGFGSYNILSDGGASALLSICAGATVNVTDAVEVDTGDIKFVTFATSNSVAAWTGGLDVYGGTMTVGASGIAKYVTLNIDALAFANSPTLTIYVSSTTGAGSTVAVSGQLTLSNTPSLKVFTEDGLPPQMGGSWDVLTFGSRVKNNGADFTLASWAGSGHNFNTKYTVSN